MGVEEDVQAVLKSELNQLHKRILDHAGVRMSPPTGNFCCQFWQHLWVSLLVLSNLTRFGSVCKSTNVAKPGGF